MYDHIYNKCNFHDLPEDREYELCSFHECDFSGEDLSDMKFIDCRFENCDMSNITLIHTAFRNVHFDNCKMMGLFFEQCNGFGMEWSFSSCVLDYSSFRGLTIRDTHFKDCKLIEADLSEADLSHCIFDNCDLDRVSFNRTNCENTDFHSAVNLVIDPDNNRLKKAKFSFMGLPGLLLKHEIEIID